MKNIIQIILAYTYKNFYLWVGIEFIFSIIACIILNWKIRKTYPWLTIEKNKGKYLIKKYPDILIKTKQVFIHKIKDFVLVRSDELFVFLFVSLQMVAFYGNYMIIISKLTSLFNSIIGSVGASIGNLVAEGNKENIMKVFWEFTTIQHTIAAILSFTLYTLIEPFIAHWLGIEYIMDHHILILLVIYVYLANSRGSVDAFNYAHGLYADVWSAWAELIINITITVVFGLKWGIAGILLGKIASLSSIVVIWKPYYLFSAGFKEPVILYWKGAIRNYLISGSSFALALFTLHLITINPYQSIFYWCLYAVIGIFIFMTYDLCATILFAKGAKDSYTRIKKLRKK